MRNPPRVALVTGATGFVGRFLLRELLCNTDLRIYCLVRAKDVPQGKARIIETLRTWKLWSDEFEARIAAVPGDLSQSRLGIGAAEFQTLCDEVEYIYHSGTSMNHLESYAMAKAASVGAARELLAFAVEGRPKLINYVSSLSIFGASPTNRLRVVDESASIEGEKHLSSQGYVASKWVSEKIFLLGVASGIPCNIFRLGLVWADSKLGRYDPLQREYRILKSSLLAGVGIAEYRYDMPPTPVDYVARSIVALAQKHGEGGKIYHVASPGSKIDSVFERLGRAAGRPVKIVSAYEWIMEIKRLHESGVSLPVVPLVEYAFSMSEASYLEHSKMEDTRTGIDSSKTRRELEENGISAPVVGENELRDCLEWMVTHDSKPGELASKRH